MIEDLLKIINHYGILTQLKYFYTEIYELTEAIIIISEDEKEIDEHEGVGYKEVTIYRIDTKTYELVEVE